MLTESQREFSYVQFYDKILFLPKHIKWQLMHSHTHGTNYVRHYQKELKKYMIYQELTEVYPGCHVAQ